MKIKLSIPCLCMALLPLFFFAQTSYAQQTGTLQVTIQPAEAVQAGAQWGVGIIELGRQPLRPENVLTWHNSGETISVRTIFAGFRADGIQGTELGGTPTYKPYQIVFKPINGWVTPRSMTKFIRPGDTTQVTESYTRIASIYVTIEPDGAQRAGAQWQVDGGPWNSNNSITGLTPGRHLVAFKDIAGWIRPDSIQANIISGETSRLTGTYIEKGSLTVTLQPQEANAAGAMWSVDGSAWQDSGATVSNLRLASLRVAFKQINDARWIVPEPIHVNIVSGQAAQAAATYQRSPGSLSVVIFPSELRQAGAQWRIARWKGGVWQDSDAVLAVPEGRHQLEFKEVAGWVRPATQDVNIASLQSMQSRGEYRRETGGVQVNLQPEGAVRSGARWAFVGYSWNNSGEAITGRGPGQQELEFHDAGAAWEKPANQTVNIVAGQTASVTATYQPVTGILNVMIEPKEAIQAGAQWKVGDRTWKESGASERLPVGQHRIEMSPLPGWVLSAPGPVTVVTGQTTRATATFRRAAESLAGGQLRVRIEPQGAAIAGARWRMDGGAWQTGGSLLANVPAGPHQVEFNDVSGWVKPPSQRVTVPVGQEFNTTGAYNPTTGNVRVVISPQEAVTAGAKWRADGGPWRDSDVSVPGFSAGPHRVDYKEIDKWVTPPPETVNVTAGGSALTTGRYNRK